MKYKVGDHVRIKSLDWYNRHTNGTEVDCGGVPFTSDMKRFCSRVMTISFVYADCYAMVEDLENYYTDEMIEGLVGEESANYSKVIDNGISNPIIAKTSSATIDTDRGFYSCDSDGNLEMEWNLPNGYQFKDENGNVINARKIVLEKKKKEYPKTYEECEKILGLEDSIIEGCLGYEYKLLNAFQKLLICRDAYWKIAGEEMGLGKPWEPDWDDDEWLDMYYISFDGKHIEKETGYPCCNMILIFPTEEMRDAFYENFKKEIEICKELL